MPTNCPRRVEGPFVLNDFEYLNHPDDGTCTYCGSLLPDTFMARLEASDVILSPTDKNYKVYVRNDGGEPFKQSYRIDSMDERRKEAAENLRRLNCQHMYSTLGGKCLRCDMTARDLTLQDSPELLADAEAYRRGDQLDGMDQRHWKWTTREMDETKFYFQHLSPEQQKRFVELLNAKRLKLDIPGHFYRLPFFITREPEPEQAL